MPDRDAYQVLEISPDASAGEVRDAFWRLARRFHPDGTAPDVIRMSEVNAAYERIERDRRLRGVPAPPPVATGPGPGPAAGSAPETPPASPPDAAPEPMAPRGSLLDRMRAAEAGESPLVDFGQYAGWRIAQIAAQDPRYLRWLARQTSGIRFRAAIDQAIGPDPDAGRRGTHFG